MADAVDAGSRYSRLFLLGRFIFLFVFVDLFVFIPLPVCFLFIFISALIGGNDIVLYDLNFVPFRSGAVRMWPANDWIVLIVLIVVAIILLC